MKLIKKILRIICIILPCFGVVLLNSSDSFATTYKVDSFLAHGRLTGLGASSFSPSISVVSTLASNADFHPRHFAYLTAEYDSNSLRCINPEDHRGWSLDGNTVTFGYSFYSFLNYEDVSPFTFLPSSPSTYKCRMFDMKYDSNSEDSIMPNVSFSGASVNIQSYDTTHGMYNVYFLTLPFEGNRVRDGITYTGNLSLMSFLNNFYGSANDSSDIDGDNSNDRSWVAHATDVSSFSMPLNFIVDEDISSLSVSGSLSFLPSTSQSSTYGSIGYLTNDFLSNGRIEIVPRYLYWDNDNHSTLRYSGSEYYSCSWSYSNSLLNLNYACSFSLAYSDIIPESLGLTLRFVSTSGSSIFLSDDVVFNDITVISNGVDTSPVLAGIDEFGAFAKTAPGNPDIEDAYGNWTDSFLNAIHFSLENPFSVIFNMFLAPDECANIPTLSRFLHVSNQRICRFYPDWIYPITTPVFAIITAVIIFGALIRWLSHDSFTYYRGVD